MQICQLAPQPDLLTSRQRHPVVILPQGQRACELAAFASLFFARLRVKNPRGLRWRIRENPGEGNQKVTNFSSSNRSEIWTIRRLMKTTSTPKRAGRNSGVIRKQNVTLFDHTGEQYILRPRTWRLLERMAASRGESPKTHLEKLILAFPETGRAADLITSK